MTKTQCNCGTGPNNRPHKHCPACHGTGMREVEAVTAKHTPGPLEVHPWAIGGRELKDSAYMPWAIEQPGTQSAIAAVKLEPDAYLYAAAPELLAACKALLSHVTGYNAGLDESRRFAEAKDAARAAIAKVEAGR